MIRALANLIKNKEKIAIVLFFIAILLLVGNVISRKLYPIDTAKNKDLSTQEINQQFISAIKKFGFKDEWISKKVKKNKSPVSLFPEYTVKVPSDLPIPVLLNQIFEDFSHDEVNIISKEINAGGLSVLEINSSGKKKLKANFNYDTSIKRKTAFIGFIIYDEGKIDNDDFLLLNSSAERFAFLFYPSNALSDILRDCNKEFSLLLNDNISDVDYKLEPGYSEGRLHLSINDIINSFGNAAFFIVDENSSIFKSSKGERIINWLTKNKINFLNKNSIKELYSEFNLSQKFNDILNAMNDGGAKLILVSPEDYLSIKENIIAAKKIGYKFINPSEVLQINQSTKTPL